MVGVYFRVIGRCRRSTTTCTPRSSRRTRTPDAPTYTAEVRLVVRRSRCRPRLRQYIDSTFYDFYRTEVFSTGPAWAPRRPPWMPEAGLATTTGPSVVDLKAGREVHRRPAERAEQAPRAGDLRGRTGRVRPTEVRTTPMINATAVTMNDALGGRSTHVAAGRCGRMRRRPSGLGRVDRPLGVLPGLGFELLRPLWWPRSWWC